MTSYSGIEKPPHREAGAKYESDLRLVVDDVIELDDGQFATVAHVALQSRDTTMRDMQVPNFRIRVTIPGKSGSSGSVITEQGAFFTKLVGVRLK